VGTGGPDFVNAIFPTIKVIGRPGYEEVPTDEVRRHFDAVLAARRDQGAAPGPR
jgi:hypothetical protein